MGLIIPNTALHTCRKNIMSSLGGPLGVKSDIYIQELHMIVFGASL